MKIKSQKDFFAGLMFVVVGGAFAIGSRQYNLGSGAQMGPGYFPLVLGVLLAVLGLVTTIQSLVRPAQDGDTIGRIAWKPLFFIIAANLVFGVCIGGLPFIGLEPLGLIVGIYLLTYIASHAGEEHNLIEVAILASVLAGLSYGAFILLLHLQLPVWPAYFNR